MEQNQLNIKEATSERLALIMAEQYEKISECRNIVLIIHGELQLRLAEKKQHEIKEINDDTHP